MSSTPVPVAGDESMGRGPTLVLWALFVVGLLAVVGFGAFALNPQNIPQSEIGVRFFAISYPLFGQLQIAVAGVALFYVLALRLRLRWVPALLAVYAISFLAEYTGTRWGIPFGGYEYTGLLGPKLADRVPYWIPLSWFLMAVPSFILSARAFPEPGRWPARLGLATALLVAWDLALDPAMSYLTPYWIWEVPGIYYGMPAVNLAGWAATGAALMIALEMLGAREWAPRFSVRWMVAYYLVMILLPLGMAAAGGLWWAVVATLVAVGPLLLIVRSRVAVPGSSIGMDPSPLTPAPSVRTP